MSKKVYIVATIRPWNIKAFKEVIQHYPGTWHLITQAKDLTPARIKRLNPRYIFFPHWSHKVPATVINCVECVCFHETNVPFGRGGSPIQNLIVRGYKKTKITALRMTNKLDAGPVYLKRHLSLHGRAEEIFIRSSRVVSRMIKEIVAKEPCTKPQKGKVVMFKRRTPEQSQAPLTAKTIRQIYDHIRMLDAPEYPKAFIECGGYRYEFSNPVLRAGTVEANVEVSHR